MQASYSNTCVYRPKTDKRVSLKIVVVLSLSFFSSISAFAGDGLCDRVIAAAGLEDTEVVNPAEIAQAVLGIAQTELADTVLDLNTGGIKFRAYRSVNSDTVIESYRVPRGDILPFGILPPKNGVRTVWQRFSPDQRIRFVNLVLQDLRAVLPTDREDAVAIENAELWALALTTSKGPAAFVQERLKPDFGFSNSQGKFALSPLRLLYVGREISESEFFGVALGFMLMELGIDRKHLRWTSVASTVTITEERPTRAKSGADDLLVKGETAGPERATVFHSYLEYYNGERWIMPHKLSDSYASGAFRVQGSFPF